MNPISQKEYLKIAFPLAVSNLSTPIIGVVDTAVVGNLSSSAYIGGVAIGTLIFNTLYWLLGFLRVGTSGFAAQALGAKDDKQLLFTFYRPLLISFAIGLLFILFQWPIIQSFLFLLKPSVEVKTQAEIYYHIRIWGAPFALANYVLIGWILGRSKVKLMLYLQLYMNVINAILCVGFVYGLGMKVNGVAFASLFAEISSFIIGSWMVQKEMKQINDKIRFKECFKMKEMVKLMQVNRDLFLRTICLLTVFQVITAISARMGNDILAANTILLQVHYIMAYTLEGFANASSLLAGKAVGEKNPTMMKRVIRLSAIWSFISAIVLSTIYFIGKEFFISIFTKHEKVVDLAIEFSSWIVLFPLAGAVGLIFYGIFTGATDTSYVRNSTFFACVLFIITILLTVPWLQNHGIWLSFIIFTLFRSIGLIWYLPSLSKTTKQAQVI
ncbi:MATE family efflux transporter [Bacillus sp. 03113]|uniref:MATE family efflux transporter n=1 Tax=Bacillus sp. 03113 TaxID=2578211 RepID=UPI00215C3D11|nr:MATE family efflux transporter [Bacillus sp. 03113]